jgi:hypothetical protein
MHIVSLRLLRGTTVVDYRQVRRAVYRAARPADGLQHVYVQGDFEGADVVLFVSAADGDRAAARAARIVHRSLTDDELLGWKVAA